MAPLHTCLLYALEDEIALGPLRSHLGPLERQGYISVWDSQQILPGEDLQVRIETEVARADVIVPLVSAGFFAAEPLERWLRLALERHRRGECMLVPVALRAVDLSLSPFAGMQHLPRNGRPVLNWDHPDEAWVEVATGIRTAAEHFSPHRLSMRQPAYAAPDAHALSAAIEPSGSLAIAAAILAQRTQEEIRSLKERRKLLLKEGGDPEQVVQVEREVARILSILRQGRPIQRDDVFSGRYEMQAQVGTGGFATVWKAFDSRKEQLVAIKILHHQYVEDATRRERFFRGSEQMARLNHPGIVRVFEERAQDGPYYYFVMEYVPGGDLRAQVLRSRLPSERALRIIQEIGEALEHAHRQGVFHRDVKPANVLLRPDGSGCLTDFDLVRVQDGPLGTRSGEGLIGTFIYTAPEVLESARTVDARSDVFSLGMTALFALYGMELPASAFRNADSLIASLGCPDVTKTVLRRAVQWDPERRYPTMTAFCAAWANSFLGGSQNVNSIWQSSLEEIGTQQQTVLHRDLKPANVMLAQDSDISRVKLIDFGIVALAGHTAQETFEFLTGIWKDVISDTTYCARMVDGIPRVAYCYGGDDTLTGHYYNLEFIEGEIFGKFEWLRHQCIRGYVYLRIETSDFLVGGWWYAEDVNDMKATPIREIKNWRNNMHTSVFKRLSSADSFPIWAEDYFRDRRWE